LQSARAIAEQKMQFLIRATQPSFQGRAAPNVESIRRTGRGDGLDGQNRGIALGQPEKGRFLVDPAASQSPSAQGAGPAAMGNAGIVIAGRLDSIRKTWRPLHVGEEFWIAP
jgi:hypothetical protein